MPRVVVSRNHSSSHTSRSVSLPSFPTRWLDVVLVVVPKGRVDVVCVV